MAKQINLIWISHECLAEVLLMIKLGNKIFSSRYIVRLLEELME